MVVQIMDNKNMVGARRYTLGGSNAAEDLRQVPNVTRCHNRTEIYPINIFMAPTMLRMIALGARFTDDIGYLKQSSGPCRKVSYIRVVTEQKFSSTDVHCMVCHQKVCSSAQKTGYFPIKVYRSMRTRF